MSETRPTLTLSLTHLLGNRVLEFDQDSVRLGALNSSDVCLSEPGVNRLHAVVEFDGQSYYIIDLGSLKGTFVNGERVRKKILQSGDTILLGEAKLAVLIGAPPTEASPKEASTEVPETKVQISPSPWREFVDSGLLFWVNRSLHLFGWALAYEETPEGEILAVYPAKVPYKGFTREDEDEGFAKLDTYFKKHFGGR